MDHVMTASGSVVAAGRCCYAFPCMYLSMLWLFVCTSVVARSAYRSLCRAVHVVFGVGVGRYTSRGVI